jgi:hypothetical protein
MIELIGAITIGVLFIIFAWVFTHPTEKHKKSH